MLRASPRRLAVNSAVSAEIFNKEWPDHVGSSRERIISNVSPEFGSAAWVNNGQGRVAWTWPSANKPIATPFRVFKGMTVYQLGWRNGSGTMTDSYDVGIYDAAWNRKVSGGGTARGVANAMQWVDVTDTFLPVGKYFLVAAANGVTANNAAAAVSSTGATVQLIGLLGCFDSATNAYPLPDPLTNMVSAATFTQIPGLFIAARVPF